MSAFSKAALYAGRKDLPPLVEKTIALATRLNFIHCCIPEQGALLQLLARARAGGTIGETGTGCGTGLAWIASAVGPETKIVSVEIDEMRARACQELFAALPNVTVLQGDWRQITAHGPFDLLVLDGGGGGKKEKDAPAEPAKLLKPGGTVVLDDMYPPLEHWPEADGPGDEFTRPVTVARRYWLQHPDLFATEIRLRAQMGTIVATLKASRP